MIDETGLAVVADQRLPLSPNDGLAVLAAGSSDDDVEPASLRGGGGGGFRLGLTDGADAEADDEDDAPSPSRRCCRVPTMVLIVAPIIIFVVVTFLAAALLPKHAPSPTSAAVDAAPKPHDDAAASAVDSAAPKPHSDVVAPTLLLVRDVGGGGLMNVRGHPLYRRLRRAVFREPEAEAESHAESRAESRLRARLEADRDRIGYGDALTLTWDDGAVGDEDIIALYCPSGEADPRKFRDAATIAQAGATHGARAGGVWSIPSFPIVREGTCEFRLYVRSGEWGYARAASTGPISLSSGRSPTGIHIGLSGAASEMYIQFTTAVRGEALAEITRRDDVDGPSGAAEVGRRLEGDAAGDGWTRLEGVSDSYLASDMCQAPATLDEPGFFVPPGHLHTVQVSGLEPDTEYVYRVGLGYGQGVEWSDDFSFRSSPPPGAGPPSPDDPALRFLAFGDQGCGGSASRGGPGADPPATLDGGDPAGDVAGLVSSLIDDQRIDSVHQFGDLSYADGAAHVWDAWMDMIQPYASQVPVLVGVGNHEYDHTEGGGGGRDPSGVTTEFGFQPSWGEGSFNSNGGECGVPVAKRFAVPDNGNGVFWYSFDQSLVHTVMLSSEHNMTAGSPQYVWLEKDLRGVNRSITPWIVVEMHRPMYNSEILTSNVPNRWSGPMVSEGMQNEIEDLLHELRVDLVLSGHYHSYFRSCDGLYLGECDSGGPTYVTVGTGGAPLSNTNTTQIPNSYTEVYDKEHWGVGSASVYNRTALMWQFVTVGRVIRDEVWLTRERGPP